MFCTGDKQHVVSFRSDVISIGSAALRTISMPCEHVNLQTNVFKEITYKFRWCQITDLATQRRARLKARMEAQCYKYQKPTLCTCQNRRCRSAWLDAMGLSCVCSNDRCVNTGGGQRPTRAPAARRGIRGFAWAGRQYGSERVQLGCPAASSRSCRWRMYGSPTRPNCFGSCG